MSKGLFKVQVIVSGAEYPYIYQFDNSVAAWDFANEARKMSHVVDVVDPDWPTKLYGKASLGDALKDVMQAR